MIEDEENLCWFLRESFAARGFEASYRLDGEQGIEAISQERPDVVILDINLPGIDGREVLRTIRKEYSETLVFVLTAYDSAELAVECLELGAIHYMTKPFDNHELVVRVEKAISEQLRLGRLEALHTQILRDGSLGDIIGRSKAMRGVFDLIERIAESESTTVLLTGETGTGKETVAKAIHNMSPRRDEPFLAVNCTALPETLLESELFGHERGAFTGANKQRRGYFELAGGGSLFLDEIGDLSADAQAKLLRVLQERKIMRLGGSKDIDVDVRIIAATNRRLEDMMEQGRFRDDLYYRLNVYPIHLPPLKERERDVLLLADHFLKQISKSLGREVHGFTEKARELMLQSNWPGNARQLRNCIERAILLSSSQTIGPFELGLLDDQDVSDESRSKEDYRLSADIECLVQSLADIEVSLAELEQHYILKLMEKHEGHRGRVSKILGMDPKTLYRKLKKYTKEKAR